MNFIRSALRRAFLGIERVFDGLFGTANNPFNQLGALGWFFYWIVAVSGIYVYIFLDTSVVETYRSVEEMTHTQWYAGGVMRSLHRYASDALVVVMLIHVVREFAFDRYRGARWFSWVIGVPILWLVYASGVSGYWLVWDVLAQYVAIASAEWLDALPIFGEPIARNFLAPGSLSDRFFTLLVFIHIAVPLILLFVLWIHLQRITRPKINPPRMLAAGTMLSLIALSLWKPALSQGGAANLGEVPAQVGLDWFYLAIYPLLDSWPHSQVWVLAGGVTLVVFLMPWLPPLRRREVAVVDLAHCNGCTRCAADCPYAAITMKPRTDGRSYAQEAVVSSRLCVGCGICVGACPMTTPFRRKTDLVSGIDLPALSLKDMREKVHARLARLPAPPEGGVRILAFGCQYGVDVESLAGGRVAAIGLPCTGMLAPSFIDYVLSRHLADGVLLTGCGNGACFNRYGARWTEERLAGTRDPHLRSRVARERLAVCWAGPTERSRLAAEIEAFAARLRALPPPPAPSRPVPGGGTQDARSAPEAVS